MMMVINDDPMAENKDIRKILGRIKNDIITIILFKYS